MDDMRSQAQFKSLRAIRFVIGGAINFLSLYCEACSGISPATNFCKFRPYDLLLSSEETASLLEITFPELSSDIAELVIEWSGGHLHYILEFAKWILRESQQVENLTMQALTVRLKDVIEEQNKIPLFSHCHSAWHSTLADPELLDLLAIAISSGYISDPSKIKGRLLANMGLLVEKSTKPGLFYPANKLVELFLRQRFAECGKALPIESSAIWTRPSLNTRAYVLILEIENRLRNFIGDSLFAKYKSEWIECSLENVKSNDGRLMLEKTRQRQEQDQKSIYARSDVVAPFLTFLDFPDLGLIVEENNDVFSEEFSTELPIFLKELVYHRRLIAHNRTMTLDQINTLKSRWRIIQRMMVRHL